nr:MAG TPA: cellulose biosynthesis protein [Caudoviricetes sp.]
MNIGVILFVIALAALLGKLVEYFYLDTRKRLNEIKDELERNRKDD